MPQKMKVVCLFVFLLQGLTLFLNGQSLSSFIPKEYRLLDSTAGDLNNDTYPDVIMVLKGKQETDTSSTERPLLILEGISKGKYKLSGRNDHIVFCASCGGAIGDPYQALAIEKGTFSVLHYGGAAMRWAQIITFVYKPETGKFILQSDTGDSFNSTNPNKVKKIKNQKENWGKVTFEDYRNDKD